MLDSAPTMRPLVLLAILALPLAGCASRREEAVQASAPSPECRHLMSPQGKPLRFCELGNKLVVDDQSLSQDASKNSNRLIDDPQFLADMLQQLPLQQPPATPTGKKPPNGKKPAAEKVCTMAQPGYVTIAVKDIQRLMQLSAERAAQPKPESTAVALAAAAEED